MNSKEITICSHIITNEQLREGLFQLEKDNYGIASYLLTDCRVKASRDNPFNDKVKCSMFFSVVNGVIGGRFQLFGTRIKVGDKIIECGTGSSLEVAEPYRKLGIGVDIMSYFTYESGYKVFLAAGITDMALPAYRALSYKILEYPNAVLIYDSKSVLSHYGLNGLILKLTTTIVNFPLKILKVRNKLMAKSILKKYEIKRETKVPTWVDDIVLNDGHKYMEIHDCRWLQWCLENKFHEHVRNKSSFYSVYYREKPIGFFMTTERFHGDDGNLKNIMRGSIVEWGTALPAELSEENLYMLALSTFSNDIATISIASSDKSFIKKMKRYGFIQFGTSNIAFYDSTSKYEDAKDINLWRIRACGDTILS